MHTELHCLLFTVCLNDADAVKRTDTFLKITALIISYCEEYMTINDIQDEELKTITMQKYIADSKMKVFGSKIYEK